MQNGTYVYGCSSQCELSPFVPRRAAGSFRRFYAAPLFTRSGLPYTRKLQVFSAVLTASAVYARFMCILRRFNGNYASDTQYREFYSFFALLLRTTYYRLFHGLLTFAFARGFLSPSRTGRFAPSRWYSPRRLGYSVSRRRSHVSGVRASTTSTVYTINTNLLFVVSIRFTEKKHFSRYTSTEFTRCAVSQTSLSASKKCKV